MKASNKFSAGSISHLKSTVVERSKAKAEFERLKSENVDMNADDIIDKMAKTNKFSAGDINWLKSIVELSEIKAMYDELIGSDMDPDDAFAEIEKSEKFGDSTINWYKAHFTCSVASLKKGNLSMAAAREAVKDGNIENAPKNLQVIAENLDEGHKKKADTHRLNQDIKTLEKGGDKVVIRCTKDDCGDTRPFALNESTTKDQTMGNMFSFGTGSKRNGLSCLCSKQHRDDWKLVCLMADQTVTSTLVDLKGQAAKIKADNKTEKAQRKKKAAALKKEEDAKEKASQKETESKKASNTKSSVDNNKSTSSKSLGKRKASKDKVDKKKKSKNADSSKATKQSIKSSGNISQVENKTAPAKKKGPKKKAIKSKSSVVGTSSKLVSMPSKSSKSKGKRKSSKSIGDSTSLCLASAQHSSSLVATATVIDVSTDERCVKLRKSYWEGNLQEDMNFIVAQYEELSYLDIIKIFEATSNCDEASLSCQRRSRNNRKKGKLPGPR